MFYLFGDPAAIGKAKRDAVNELMEIESSKKQATDKDAVYSAKEDQDKYQAA